MMPNAIGNTRSGGNVGNVFSPPSGIKIHFDLSTFASDFQVVVVERTGLGQH